MRDEMTKSDVKWQRYCVSYTASNIQQAQQVNGINLSQKRTNTLGLLSDTWHLTMYFNC